MQKILGYMRKAIQEYDLIKDGDRICVGADYILRHLLLRWP